MLGRGLPDPAGPFVTAVQDAVEAATGVRPEASTTGGTSDARFIRAMCPVLELGLVGQTMHQVDERVPSAELEALTGVYRRASIQSGLVLLASRSFISSRAAAWSSSEHTVAAAEASAKDDATEEEDLARSARRSVRAGWRGLMGRQSGRSRSRMAGSGLPRIGCARIG